MADDEALRQVPSNKKDKITVERMFRRMSQLDHILSRPDMYIGSVQPVTQGMWVLNQQTSKIINKDITYIPGLQRIYDEVLVNAADHKQRDETMNCIKITINKNNNFISIYNNGSGIPVVMHKLEKMYVPSLIFGQILTSSNYDDSEGKTTAGRNGYGAKLCNAFSTTFMVETSAKFYNKSFKQTWHNNMRVAEKPQISACETNDFTRVTFYPDLQRFNINELDDENIALMYRRAYDIAGCTKGVKVYLNNTLIPVKNFRSYINMYMKTNNPPNIVHEIVNNSWEVAVTVSDHGFQQISFVNSIATTKGGRHVDHIVDHLVPKIAEEVKKKNKGGKEIKPSYIKSHLFIFINCLIKNAVFDSQGKESMTLQKRKFNSTCHLSEKFIEETLKTEIVARLISWAKFQAQNELAKKFSGDKVAKLKIAKLEDANEAGTINSIDCTLILTEGDSAKSLAMSGFEVVGRDKYGVFPLQGKIMNVRDSSEKQLLRSVELNHIVKILGLKYKTVYKTVDDIKTLRYGHLMIMADQDVDGSHIKGLLINFFHCYWPSLLKLPFLQELITPIVKATKGKEEKSFFSLPHFNEWKNKTPNWLDFKIKYYKGLGTSTAKEGRQYFSDMSRHRVEFYYAGPNDDYAIQLAFSKNMADERKNWLKNAMEARKKRRELGLYEEYLYGKNNQKVSYYDFIHKELIHFSIKDTERSIPSLVDGMKPGQRKIIFTCLKRNDKREVKVAQLSGSVAELSCYHHGEMSLNSTIINLAQNFTGSNNLNLLLPIGQFGSRLEGGKDAASPRYIYTMLNPLTKLIFPSEDFPILNYLFEENQKIEPELYIPILPMVLVNGAEGIATGWKTKVYGYNPREIIQNIYRMMTGSEPEEMNPWFKNFRGTIERVKNHYIVSGEIALLGDDRVEITELPPHCWIENYKETVLEPMLHGTNESDYGKEKIKPSISIQNYKEYHTDTTIKFIVKMTTEQLTQAKVQGLHKIFKLQTSISIDNMVLYNEFGCVEKFDSSEDILRRFYPIRFALYEQRKEYIVGMLAAEASKLENQATFILEKIDKKFTIENYKKVEIIKTLKEKKYVTDPVKAWLESQINKDKEESDSEDKITESGPNYDYLLCMPLLTLTLEKKEELLKKRDEKVRRLNNLMNKSASDLWREDLEKFIQQLDDCEKKEKEMLSKEVREDTVQSIYSERIIPNTDDFKKKYEKQLKRANETRKSKNETSFAEKIDGTKEKNYTLVTEESSDMDLDAGSPEHTTVMKISDSEDYYTDNESNSSENFENDSDVHSPSFESDSSENDYDCTPTASSSKIEPATKKRPKERKEGSNYELLESPPKRRKSSEKKSAPDKTKKTKSDSDDDKANYHLLF